MVPGERIATRNSHGTGCSLSSAMATVQARLGDWEAALREVKPWLHGALREAAALDVGSGNGPVHHFHHAPAPRRPAAAGSAFTARRRRVRRGPAAGARRSRRHLRPGLHPRAGRRDPAREPVRLLPRPGRHLPQRLLPGPGPGSAPGAHRGRTAVLGPFGADVPGSGVGAAPDLAGHPPRGAAGPGDQVLRGPPAGRLGRPAATRCWWPRPCRATGSTPRWVPPCTGSSSPTAPRAHPYADWLRTYADEDFAAATRQAIAYHGRGSQAASDQRAGGHGAAFRQSSRLRSGLLRRAAAARLIRPAPRSR